MRKGWMWLGEEAFKKADEDRVQRQSENVQGDLMAWWLKKGETGQFIFLDTPTHYTKRHHSKIRQKDVYLTCTQDMAEYDNECVPCDELENNYPAGMLLGTIISLRPFKTRQGKTMKASRMKIEIKGDNIDFFKRQIAKRDGSLKFCVFEATRGTKSNSYSVGSEFEYVEKKKKSEILALKPKSSDLTDEEWLAVMDYELVYAPKSPDEQRKVLGLKAPMGRDEDDEDQPTPRKKRAPVEVDEEDEDEDEEDLPDPDEEEEDEEPPPRKKRRVEVDEDEDEEDEPPKKRRPAKDLEEDEEPEETPKPKQKKAKASSTKLADLPNGKKKLSTRDLI